MTQGAKDTASHQPAGNIGPAPDISVIITVDERPEPLVALYDEYAEPLLREGWDFEFIFVAQPEHRTLLGALAGPSGQRDRVHVLSLGQHASEATLLKIGTQSARGRIIVTMPAYRRVEAAAIPLLIAAIRDGADVAVARRSPRRDPWLNRVQNRAFHLALAVAAGGELHDVASGVRAMRRHVLEEIVLYGEFARFLPLLAQREGYEVVELQVPQHSADTRARWHGPRVFLNRTLDLITLFFLTRFTDKPLRFFGLIGGTISFTGAVLLLLLLIQKLGGHGIANRPLLLLGALLFVTGVQAVALGLVGEIIVNLSASRQRRYRLARTLPQVE